MARKTVFGSIRSGLLPTALSSASNSKRAKSTTQLQMWRFSRPGGTKSILATASSSKRGYAKLPKISSSCSSSSSSSSSCSQPQQAAKSSKKQASRKREQRVPSNSSTRSQSSFQHSKQAGVLANSQLLQMSKGKSKLRRLIDKLQESYDKLREAARQSNLQFADLFTGNQMLMHVTAAPVSRRSRKAMKHSPSVWHWTSSSTTSKKPTFSQSTPDEDITFISFLEGDDSWCNLYINVKAKKLLSNIFQAAKKKL